MKILIDIGLCFDTNWVNIYDRMDFAIFNNNDTCASTIGMSYLLLDLHDICRWEKLT